MAFCKNTPTNPCLLGGSAYWNATTFGANQAASYLFDNTLTPALLPGYSLILKATGGTATAPTSFIRVSYSPAGGGTITVATTTNGLTFTTAGTFTGTTFATNDTMGAMVNATGLVTVWKTSGGVTTVPGSVQLPSVAAWTTGGGRIGIRLSPGDEVDNFAGGNVI